MLKSMQKHAPHEIEMEINSVRVWCDWRLGWEECVFCASRGISVCDDNHCITNVTGLSKILTTFGNLYLYPFFVVIVVAAVEKRFVVFFVLDICTRFCARGCSVSDAIAFISALSSSFVCRIRSFVRLPVVFPKLKLSVDCLKMPISILCFCCWNNPINFYLYMNCYQSKLMENLWPCSRRIGKLLSTKKQHKLLLAQVPTSKRENIDWGLKL